MTILSHNGVILPTIPGPLGLLFPLLRCSFPLNPIHSSLVTLKIFYSRKHFPNSKYELVAPCFCFCVYLNHDSHYALISIFADPALTVDFYKIGLSLTFLCCPYSQQWIYPWGFCNNVCREQRKTRFSCKMLYGKT